MSISIPSYDQCVNNLSAFVQSLMKNPTKILFLYFTVKKTPYVKTKFGKWEFKTDNSVYYILPGDDENFAYVYRDSQLKALIDIIDPNAPSPFNASFDAPAPHDPKYEVSLVGHSVISKDPTEVNIGNHLDYSIRQYTRNKTKVRVVSSHLTKYTIHPDGSATRDAQVQSDFTLEQTDTDFLDSLARFGQTALIKTKILKILKI